VYIEETYIGEGLSDSEANANLMSLKKASELGNMKMIPYNKTIGYANGQVEMAIGILYSHQSPILMHMIGINFIVDSYCLRIYAGYYMQLVK